MKKGSQIENKTESDLKIFSKKIDKINRGFSMLKYQFSRNKNLNWNAWWHSRYKAP